MKTLMILRHAKATHDLPVADFDRPLRGKGQRDADALGRALAEKNMLPDYILCSSATRARQTAEGLLAACGQSIDIDYRREIYLAPWPDYCGCVRSGPDEKTRVMIVGHNPAIEDWIAALAGHPQSMPPGSLAVMQLAIDYWADLTGKTRGKLLEVRRPGDEC
jgi:phosphohistidine phosphatase